MSHEHIANALAEEYGKREIITRAPLITVHPAVVIIGVEVAETAVQRQPMAPVTDVLCNHQPRTVVHATATYAVYLRLALPVRTVFKGNRKPCTMLCLTDKQCMCIVILLPVAQTIARCNGDISPLIDGRQQVIPRPRGLGNPIACPRKIGIVGICRQSQVPADLPVGTYVCAALALYAASIAETPAEKRILTIGIKPLQRHQRERRREPETKTVHRSKGMAVACCYLSVERELTTCVAVIGTYVPKAAARGAITLINTSGIGA